MHFVNKTLIDTCVQVSMLSKTWLEHHDPDLMIKENHNLLDEPDQLTLRWSTSYLSQVFVDKPSQLHLFYTLFCTFLYTLLHFTLKL